MQSILGIIAILLTIWVIYDVLTQQQRMNGGKKALWIIIAIILPIVGAIIYYLLGKK